MDLDRPENSSTDPDSSSSILLQKARNFLHTPYVTECCKHIALHGHEPSDKYLQYMVHLQRLIEEVDDTVAREGPTKWSQHCVDELQRVKESCAEIRSSLPFPLSESRKTQSLTRSITNIATDITIAPILMQLNLLELLLSQSSPGGNTFGLDKFQNIQSLAKNQPLLLDWLSTSMSAVRSLVGVILVLPPGEEDAVSNTEWIMLYCGLSMAVRLDLIAAHGSTSGATHHLRRFLDMPHTLRQIVLRLESATSPDLDATGDRDAFYHLASRARRLEEWYLECCSQAQLLETGGLADIHLSGDTKTSHSSNSGLGSTAMSDYAIGATQPQEGWGNSLNIDYGADVGLGTFLFSDPLGNPMDFENWTTFS